MSIDGPFGMHVLPFFSDVLCILAKKKFLACVEFLIFEKNEIEQKLNFNHNALTIEQFR